MKNMDYEVYFSRGEKRVRITAKGEKYDFGTEKMYGHEFFYVPNYRDSSDNFIFLNRVKDAYDIIFDGDGDCFKGEFFQEVIFFLDRDYGESKRMEFLEKWKDKKFSYAIGNGIMTLGVHGDFCMEKSDSIRYFENEAQAQDYLNYCQSIQKAKAETYINMSANKHKDFISENFPMPLNRFLFNLFKDEIRKLSEGVFYSGIEVIQVVV